MPRDGDARAAVMSSLRLGLQNRNRDLLERGASNKDKAIEVLLFVNREFAYDAPFLRDTLSAEALDALARLVSAQARRGNAPLGPREWGQFLEHVVWRGATETPRPRAAEPRRTRVP